MKKTKKPTTKKRKTISPAARKYVENIHNNNAMKRYINKKT